jgi:MarR family transcriptional regulator for hemolysin
MNDGDDITSVLLFQIDLTGKIAKQYSQRQLDERGVNITVDQWVLLRIIQESQQLSQRELAVKSKRDPASITRSLDLLEKKGLVAREGVEGNRRQYEVVLTEGGKAFVSQNLPEIKEHGNLSVKGISKADLKKAFDVLDQIQVNMK